MTLLRKTLALAFLLLAAAANAQSDDAVLFTVADRPVTVGEFRYIYEKTSGDQVTYDRASVMEYLDLYERFKLKVVRAYDMGLDTVKSLQQELEGYRRQLADNYLVDKQVTDRLVADLYERQQQDIDFSHILFRFTGNPRPQDTLALYNKALEVKQGLTPATFATAARSYSDDEFSKERGGAIGFLTAPFPKGMHRLEAALYEAETDEIVGPVRTALGYHLAVKTAVRPARGEMEIAHILIRRPEQTAKGTMPVPAQLKTAKKALTAGRSFEELAKQLSEDGKTKNNGGYLGFFGINKYEKDFEDAAFALSEDGEVSDIVESNVGWHLIRRISRRGGQPLAERAPLLRQKVKSDGRFADARKAMLKETYRRAGAREDERLLGLYLATLRDSTFLDFRWTPSGDLPRGTLLSLGEEYRFGLAQFQEYLRQQGRKRVSMGRASNAATVARRLYDDWLEERLIAYAESRLETDFPEFAALMREYREGILLFEATKLEVWDKASADTTGLRAFFRDHRDRYQYPERATVAEITVPNSAGINPRAMADFAAANGVDKALDRFGRAKVEDRREPYELARLQDLGLEPKIGSVSKITDDQRTATKTFRVVTELLPPRPKQLDEARGYVIADYQDELERQWVESLRDTYAVERNEKVLKKLIRQ